LIFIGPKELPTVLNTLGRNIARLRRVAEDYRRQFDESMREAGYGDLHRNLQEIRQLHPGSKLLSTIEGALNNPTVASPMSAPKAVEPAPQISPEVNAAPELSSTIRPGEAAAEPVRVEGGIASPGKPIEQAEESAARAGLNGASGHSFPAGH
jgi:sec-independent protein translocase protein TatB